jgi:hypothetical protein
MADYDRLVKRSVSKAFRQIGTLAKTAIFSTDQPSGFDFTTGEATAGAVQQLLLRGIIADTKRPKSKDSDDAANVIMKKFIFPSDSVNNLNVYDTVTIDSIVWKIVKPIEDDGYLTTLMLAKEI